MENTLNTLRSSTHNVHKRLHDHPLLCRLITSELTLQDYKWVLFAFEGFYQNICKDIYFDLADQKLSLIRNDLSFISPEQNPLQKCDYLKYTTDLNYILGVQYVVIGSSLGGTLISRNIEKQLNLNNETGNSYFGSSPVIIQKYWGNFQAALDQKCTNLEDCSVSALNTFEGLEKWLWDVWTFKNKTGVS